MYLRTEIQTLRENTDTRFDEQGRLIMQLTERVARVEGLLTGVIASPAEREQQLRYILGGSAPEAAGMMKGVAEDGRQYGESDNKRD